MILPKDIQEIFFETLYGDRTVLEFEQWLYANTQLEHILSPEDYLDLIAYGYKGSRAAPGLYSLLEKHIHNGEYKLWKFNRQKQPRVQETPGAAIKTPFDEQLQRIKEKLSRARQADEDCDEFGSERHEYLIGLPATEEEVLAFENKYAVQLPSCYRSFLLKVGNGGIGYGASGAGPHFGIYPLGGHDVHFENWNYLKNDCLIDPDITIEQWTALTKEFERKARKLFGGILPLGSQGCTYLHAIVLNGPHKGRVVNLDMSTCIPPIYAEDINFLDWYERWLNEVIDGTQQPDTPLFGY